MSDAMTTDQPCETCRAEAREHGEPVDWWCWMFGCAECVTGHHVCGETRPA